MADAARAGDAPVATDGAGELARGRAAAHRLAWAEAYESLSRAHHAAALPAEDAELLATAGYLTGQVAGCLRALQHASEAYAAAGNPPRAARCLFWLGFTLFTQGDMAQASGWLARAARLLDEVHGEYAEHGLLLLRQIFQTAAEGDHASSEAAAAQMAEIGHRAADVEVLSFALHQQGRAAIQQGRVRDGMALLDESMVAVVAGELAQAPATEQIRDTWDALAPRFDRFTTSDWSMPLGEHALRRVDLRPGIRFLDVACGSGALAIPAARRGADVVAVDIAPAMIERLTARARAEGLSNLEGRVMNGEALELPDDTFDVSASQNGVSMLPDLAGGLREIVRVTKPGGRVLIVAFGAPQNAEFLRFFLGALQASVPDLTPLPMDPPPLPFRLADPSRFGQELADAGLTDVQVETVTWDTTFRSAAHFWDVVTSGKPIAVQLTSDLTDEQRTDVRHVLDGMLRERSGGRPEAALRTEMNIGIGTR